MINILKYFKSQKWICELKDFIQRRRYGYADRDVYDLDNYLSAWLPKALKKIKNAGSMPYCMYRGIEPDEYGQYTKEQKKAAEEKWKNIVQKMIDGFTAHQRLCYNSYSSQDEIQLRKEMRRDSKAFDEGMRLFVRYYWDLWI
jgi:hypothetical protein